MDLHDKVVLVTGASSGIGEALAEEFLQKGCRVIMAARRIARLEEYRRHLLESSKVAEDRIRTVFLDLADHDSIVGVAEQCIKFYGRIDILVNNAGVSFRDEIMSTSLDTYKKIMDVDFFGQVVLTNAILPTMLKQGGGSVVAISSLQGRFAIPYASAYYPNAPDTAAKHALQAFCDSLRAETAAKNIHVLVVSPGYVATDIFKGQLRGDGSFWNPDDRRGVYAKGMKASFVASETVKAIVGYEHERCVAPLLYRLLVYVRVLLPSVYMALAARLKKSS